MRLAACIVLLVQGLVLVAWPTIASGKQEQPTELRFEVSDADGKPVPCRIHLYNAEGKAQKAPALPFWRDHFVCTGKVALRLAPGRYTYEVERGPEHQHVKGKVELQANSPHTETVVMRRLMDLTSQDWYAGDLHIHRPLADIELLMQAEDLHIAPVITWWNATDAWAMQERPREPLQRFDGRRFYHRMAGEDERGGGALLFFHLEAPLPITKAKREFPSATHFIQAARQRDRNVWVDIEKPFWWDAPVWVASEQVDSIGLANNHMCRSQMFASEAWGRARDERQFPAPLGNGQWTQLIYYHLLNCGVRLPPSAGSASGVLPNPVGYNRVYVHVDGELEYAKWWSGLKAGRSFVTNGPLLLCQAGGKLPGHIFRTDAGQALELELDVALIGQDHVPRLEIIKNGRIEGAVALQDQVQQKAKAKVRFEESGWFLVRGVTDNHQTYRFASTAPFYVEIGASKKRISRGSVQFFLDWLRERAERLEKVDLAADEREQLRQIHVNARRWWEQLQTHATVD